MKQKISYNSVLSGLAIFLVVAFIAIFVLFWVFLNKPFDDVFFWIWFGLCCLGIIWICASVPTSVDADDDYVGERRAFNTRKYRYSEIRKAEIADANADRGVHLRGRFKNPVLITLKDGRQVLIGSENPTELVEYINSRVS